MDIEIAIKKATTATQATARYRPKTTAYPSASSLARRVRSPSSTTPPQIVSMPYIPDLSITFMFVPRAGARLIRSPFQFPMHADVGDRTPPSMSVYRRQNRDVQCTQMCPNPTGVVCCVERAAATAVAEPRPGRRPAAFNEFSDGFCSFRDGATAQSANPSSSSSSSSTLADDEICPIESAELRSCDLR